MMPRVEIYRLVQPVLGLATSNVIWADPNAPRPELPYATLKINSRSRRMSDHHGAPDDDGNAKVKGDREFTLYVQYFGPDAVAFLGTFADKMQLRSVHADFVAQKIIPYNIGDVTDVAELLGGTGGKIEPRAAVDVFFRYKSSLDDAVGVIETVVVDEE